MKPRPDRRPLLVSVALSALVLAWLALVVALLDYSLDESARQAWLEAWASRGPLLALLVVGLLIAVSALVNWVWRRTVAPVRRLAEWTQALADTGVDRELQVEGGPDLHALTEAINHLVVQRRQVLQDMDARVAEATTGVAQEKARLAALMSELSHSVVVCNRDGRVLLYNPSARELFRGLSLAPGGLGGAELIGLGRSVYGVLDRQSLAHALDLIRQRLARGQAQAKAQFVTAVGSQMLRVQVAPVRDTTSAEGLSGFVLMLENVTQQVEREAAREHAWQSLVETSRATLAQMQALVDSTDWQGTQRDAARARLQEAQAMLNHRVRMGEHEAGWGLHQRWPLEDMWGRDLLAAAARRIEDATGMRVDLAAVDDAVWLHVESYGLLQALASLAERLGDEFGVRQVALRLQPGEGQAILDLEWVGAAISTETVMGWELDPIRLGGQTLGTSVRDVVARHGGSLGFERNRVTQTACFRWHLPLAAAPVQSSTPMVLAGSRPEFYDFDLFQSTPLSRSLDDHSLSELVFTVFDTETTGLNPSQGDEIIQIGATRIVNGKVLRHESFEQLVDPQRPIPASTVPIHGIEPHMVHGQPTIDVVLPAFHAFARDTVLVAHNAAFDMRFLQLKEDSTGVVFEQPVLDTLLLSAVVHPAQESHRLEAIAERMGVTVVGRHTALGDAIVTAEVFLRLLPLLAAQGITTLGQARAAAERSYLSRLRY